MSLSHRRALILAIVLLGLGWAAIRLLRSGRGDSEEEPVGGPVASVQVVPLRRGVLREEINAYGTVVPVPGAARSITAAFESQVRRVSVINGQRVSGGQALVEIEPSPETRMKYQEQEAIFEQARTSLASVRRRFDLRLATNEDLAQAKHAFREAEIGLEGLRSQGMGPAGRVVASPFTGIVDKIVLKEGETVPAGTAILEIVPVDAIEVRLGLEAEDAGRVRVNQPVVLSALSRTASATGRVRAVSGALDPETRLVDVRVSFPPSRDFLLGESVGTRIEVASRETLIAPRSAILPEGSHRVLYTIEKGRARRHVVRTGLATAREVEILSGDLAAGAPVVVLGNYELRDGMSVKWERAP